jgi:hypothetical protein
LRPCAADASGWSSGSERADPSASGPGATPLTVLPRKGSAVAGISSSAGSTLGEAYSTLERPRSCRPYTGCSGVPNHHRGIPVTGASPQMRGDEVPLSHEQPGDADMERHETGRPLRARNTTSLCSSRLRSADYVPACGCKHPSVGMVRCGLSALGGRPVGPRTCGWA